MSEFTAFLRSFAVYSQKLDDEKINWGDFISLQNHLKTIEDGELTEKEKNILSEINQCIKDKTREFLKGKEL